ncbi:MAG: protein kinase [Acidobacteriota bacterium]
MKNTGDRLKGLPLGVKIFLATSLLIALAVGAAVAVTTILVRRIALQAIDETLAQTSAAQTAFQDERGKRLLATARLFASDPSLNAYVAEAAATRDSSSILDLLNERQRDVGFDFAIVLDSTGKVLARTDRPNGAGEDLANRPLIAKSITDFEAAGVWIEDGRLYDAVAVPLQREFNLLGFFVAGFAITDASALEVQKVSGSEVAYVTAGAKGPVVVASTMPQLAPVLAQALAASQHTMGEVMEEGREVTRVQLSLRDEPWIASVVPLKDAGGKAVGATVGFASLARELTSYREIQNALIASGLVAALLALFLSFGLARRMLAPVRQLAVAAGAARQGNYDQKIDTGRRDEVGELARSFDQLLTDLREKRDMEVYVAELSRSLPEPASARPMIGTAKARDLIVFAIELKRYARTDGDPEQVLERLASDWKRIAGAISSRRGLVESVSGHRLLARFDGEGRGPRALAAAADILGLEPDGSSDAPSLALASGAAVTGPISWREGADNALIGLPVQRLEGLLREAAPGDLLLTREVHDELAATLEAAGYRLAPRKGVLSTQPFYALSANVAARVTGARGVALIEAAAAAGGARTGAYSNAAPTLSGISPGSLLGARFEILAVLGAGGMGVVYKARDRELDDLVALKMLKRELWGDRTQLDRLKSEIKLARKITHPNVLRTHDFGEIDGVPYISMEFVRGVTLRYLLDQTQSLPYSAALRLARQLCAGLSAAHAQGVLHRDIKPENLIIEAAGNAKLMDFGIARPIDRMAPGETQAGWVVGTPMYMAPEVLQGREADVRGDLYAVGILLYEIFTGKPPFSGSTPIEIMLKQIKDEPLPPRGPNGDLDPALAAAILRCLKKDPAERFPNVDGLARVLEGLTA